MAIQAERHHIGQMTWIDYDHHVKERNPVVIVPVGSTEQHGPHTPLGCDTIVGAEIADAVATRIGALVAPPIAYGYKSQPRTGGGNHFPGNIGIDAETLSRLVSDIAQSFYRHGVERICFLSSHYENKWFIIEGIEDALKELENGGLAGVRIVCMSYYETLSPQVRDQVFGDRFISWEVEHGAVMTTSILMHRRPELVDVAARPDHPPVLLPPYDVFPFDPANGSKSGAMSASTLASAEAGKLFFDDFTEQVARALTDEFDLALGAAA